MQARPRPMAQRPWAILPSRDKATISSLVQAPDHKSHRYDRPQPCGHRRHHHCRPRGCPRWRRAISRVKCAGRSLGVTKIAVATVTRPAIVARPPGVSNIITLCPMPCRGRRQRVTSRCAVALTTSTKPSSISATTSCGVPSVVLVLWCRRARRRRSSSRVNRRPTTRVARAFVH